MYVSMGPCDGIGGGLYVEVALQCNSGMTVVTALGVFMGTPEGVGYGPGEDTRCGIDVGTNKENLMR